MNPIYHITTRELYFKPVGRFLSDMRPHDMNEIYNAIELLIAPERRGDDWRYNVRFALGKMRARGWLNP